MFEHIQAAPADPILGLNDAYKKDWSRLFLWCIISRWLAFNWWGYATTVFCLGTVIFTREIHLQGITFGEYKIKISSFRFFYLIYF